MGMAGIYARGNKLWCRLKNEDDEWVSKPTKYSVGQEESAKRYRRAAQKVIDQRRQEGKKPTGPMTLKRYSEEWLKEREEAGKDAKAERGRLKKHVWPTLGARLLADVQPYDVAELVRRLRFKTTPQLAQRTVRNIYIVVSCMFRDAAIRGLVERTPCILTDVQLGPIKDKNPEWRLKALFTREEAEMMISHPRIPLDRRVAYAFGLLAGLRPGEVGALRWRHYSPDVEPLGSLMIAKSYNTKRQKEKGTKTDTSKLIPVHPTLAGMLAEWRSWGWPALFGRDPLPDDLIIPLPAETVGRWTKRKGEPFRGYDYSSRRWREVDLAMLGWRPRSLYDTKSTFITLAIEDGADADVIRDRVTHTKARRDAFGGYDRGPHWLQTCAEVSKLRINRQKALATGLATDPANCETLIANSGSEGGYRTRGHAIDDHHESAISDESRCDDER
jgi:integrase